MKEISNPTENDLYAKKHELVIGLSQNISKISQALLFLSRKRRTLEEKAIISYLQSIVDQYLTLIDLFCGSQSQKSVRDFKDETVLDNFKHLNEKLSSYLDDLLKALKYNFNYFEQYFEYDFRTELIEKSEILQQTTQYTKEIKNYSFNDS